VSSITSAEDRGVDLALLKVPKLKARSVRIAGAQPKPGSGFAGLAYVHLHGEQYWCSRISGKVAQVVMMRAQLSLRDVPALLLTADEGTSFVPGNSGTALFDERGEVIGVLAFASRDGRRGYAISSPVLREVLATSGLSPSDKHALDLPAAAARPLPPELPPVAADDDPQKGRFGGQSADGQVELTARFRKASGESYFSFDVSVRPVQPSLHLLPPARFYLHDSYPRSVIQITRPDDAGAFSLSEVHSYGIFTIGCHVFASDERWHSVEYDLLNLPNLPEVFLNR
jgi:hypothetical protein